MLHMLNTYQIEHYDIKCSMSGKIMVRGWTSEVKLFDLVTDKNGGYLKIEKAQHLSHDDQPVCSSICNLGFYSLTVSKSMQMCLWDLKSTSSNTI